MSKSSRVPAALHSELTEYSSLLRALRTSNTLDLTGHLTRHQSEASHAYEDDEDDDLNNNASGNNTDGEDERPQTESHRATSPPATSDFDVIAPSSQPSPPPREARTRAGGTQSKGGARGKKRKVPFTKDSDLWTRWPLLSGDVHVPEWALDDEVRLIASRIINAEQHAEGEADEDDLLPSKFVDSLALDTAQQLTRILAACAHTAPTVPSKSLAGRLHPIGWEGVLASVSSCGLVSASVLERVHNRMSAVYKLADQPTSEEGPRKLPHERAAILSSSKRKCDDFCASALSLDALLHFEGPPASRRRKARKRIRQPENEEESHSEQE